jgi:hypothetical protein
MGRTGAGAGAGAGANGAIPEAGYGGRTWGVTTPAVNGEVCEGAGGLFSFSDSIGLGATEVSGVAAPSLSAPPLSDSEELELELGTSMDDARLRSAGVCAADALPPAACSSAISLSESDEIEIVS